MELPKVWIGNRFCFYGLLVLAILTLPACQTPPMPALPTSEPPPGQTSTPTPIPPPSKTATPAEATTTLTPPTQTASETPEPIPEVPEPEMPKPDGSLTLVQVAQHGGEITAATLEDGIAYAGFGPTLQAFRLNGNAPPEQVGEPFGLNFLARDLAVQNELLYLLDGEGHLFLFDVSDAPTIYVVQAFEGAGTKRVFVEGEWGFTTSETCTGGECTAQLQLFALEGMAETPPVFGPGEIGPSLPVQASLAIPGAVFQILVSGEAAYIAHQGGLLAASLPELEVLDELKAQYISGAAFAMPYAYLSGNELLRADLSNPQTLTWDRPTENVPQAGPGTPMAIVGERLYGFDTFGEFGHCWSSLRVLDLEDPSAPVLTLLDEAEIEFRCVEDVVAGEDSLLVIDWDGLHFLDLSTPDQPRLLYTYANVSGPLELVKDGWAFGGSDLAPAGLWAHDLRNLDDIRSYGPFPPRWASGMAAGGDYLFAPVWEDGLAVVDTSNPSQPTLLASVLVDQTGGPGLDAAMAGNYLYLARSEGGLGVFDVSDPARPSLVGGHTPFQEGGAWQSTRRVSTGEGYLAVLEEAWEDDLPKGLLRFFRLDDPANPEVAGEIEIDETFLRSALASTGQYTYFLGSACEGSCTHRLLIADLSAVEAPEIVTRVHLPGEAFDIHSTQNYLFVAAGPDGIYVWDVADPARPILAAHADTPGNAEKVVTLGGQVYVSDGEAGVVVFQMD